MDNESLHEAQDITNAMATDISWEELEHMTDSFSEERKIGSGGYGVVYKGVQENGKKVAVKKLYHIPGLDEKQFQNEVQVLARLEHQNIVRLIGQTYKEEERCVEYKGNLVLAKMIDRVICLEYLHNGSLEQHLSDESSGLPWHKRYQIIKGICEGLNYLHEHSVFHLDLKPGNILLDDNMLPKIADFGLSRLFSGTRMSHTTTHFIGTPGFMPPEYIEKQKISDKYDVFSLGIIIILIMTGPNGYSRHCDMASRDFIKLVHGNWMTRLSKPEWGDASYSDAHSNQVMTCILIALNCLESDRHKRPSMGDIIYDLNEGSMLLQTARRDLEWMSLTLRSNKSRDPGSIGERFTLRVGPEFLGAQGETKKRSASIFRALAAWWRRRRGNEQDASGGGAQQSLMPPPRLRSSWSQGPGSVVERFTLDMLHAATGGFSDASRIGTGSYGSVYRGTLPDGREVAIKRAESARAASAAWRRDRETVFSSELTALARANHKNIVCLLGCCADAGERVLVYEFMANGTLHDQLQSRTPMAAPAVASWRGRLGIALGAARGIEYMHVYAVPPIIHRDVKSANILLDDAWTAKIADFGLSSVLDPNAGPCAGEDALPLYTGGTVAYMDPEYYRLQHLTDKSDVYSFGVVLLELMSGCRVVQRYAESVTPKNVVEFAVPHILADDVARVLDPRLPAPTPEETEALVYVGYLAADCVGAVGCDRPSMTEVVDALERALAACGAAPLSRSVTSTD